jgi:hypothetical protein
MIIKNPNNTHKIDEHINIISIRENVSLLMIVIVAKYRSGPHDNHSPHKAAEDPTLKDYLKYFNKG